MQLSKVKTTLELIKEFQSKDYFYDKSQIETQVRNRDTAIDNGQEDARQYTDQVIALWVHKNTRNRAFHNTANSLYNAIQEGKTDEVLSKVRYDQKLTIKLYELYTGTSLPKTNKGIREIISKMLN